MADDHSAAWNQHYRNCLRYVEGVISAVDAGKRISLGPSSKPLAPPAPRRARGASTKRAKVVYCAPHPDDESLSGVLALRLRLDSGAQVTNVAITLGSDLGQRERRRRELKSACRVLGFELVVPADPSASGTAPAGFDHVNLTTRRDRPREWAAKVEALRQIFDREQPDVVFAPHTEDFNTSHIGTHWLVVEALGAHLENSGRGPVTLIQTEFWHQLAEPNLMVGVTPETVAILLAAACEHGGEMRRNPYHLLAPARMMDNVRRGSEVVGGQGAAAQAFTFAELYRVTGMRGKELIAPSASGVMLGPTEKVSVSALEARFWPQVR